MKKLKNIEKTELNRQFAIPAFSGGSGIFYIDDMIYIISDKSNVLSAFDADKGQIIRKISLQMDGSLEENIMKKYKPDFEAFVPWDGRYYIFGSGSAKHRFDLVIIDEHFRFVERSSIKNLYQAMMEMSGIGSEDFNIEGVILTDESALFFNRGNGPNRKNGIISVKNWLTGEPEVTAFKNIVLPAIDGQEASFSDAILHNGHICFLANAEDTRSVYDDGKVAGSAIGLMHLDTLEVLDYHIIERDVKYEGITMYKQLKEPDRTVFLLCDDNDFEHETLISQLTVFWGK